MRVEPWRARVEDLQDGDIIEVRCLRCGHEAVLTPADIRRRILPGAQLCDGRLCAETWVNRLTKHLKCSRCPPDDWQGRPHRETWMRAWPKGTRTP